MQTVQQNYAKFTENSTYNNNFQEQHKMKIISKYTTIWNNLLIKVGSSSERLRNYDLGFKILKRQYCQLLLPTTTINFSKCDNLSRFMYKLNPQPDRNFVTCQEVEQLFGTLYQGPKGRGNLKCKNLSHSLCYLFYIFLHITS